MLRECEVRSGRTIPGLKIRCYLDVTMGKCQSFIESAERSVESFKQTGIAYGHQDVKRWFLAKLRGQESPEAEGDQDSGSQAVTRVASLVFAEHTIEDLARLAEFLAEDKAMAAATGPLILEALGILESHPLIGASVAGPLRQLLISRGRTGYVALYAFDAETDQVVIHAIRHPREAGFEE